ncbi:MAG: histidinol-phosphate transaminase [Rikenellaceae bacterium]
MMNIKELVRENIKNLAPYSTARDDYQGGELGIFLDANENPYQSGYNRYPDPHQIKLKEQLSKIKGVGVQHIFIGNGSDEPIDLLFRVFCDPGVHNAISITPTYGMYRVSADINNVEMREVSLKADFSLDCGAIIAASDAQSRLLFLCSPNNPTANLLAVGDVEWLLDNFKGIVVVDEAYIDFAASEGFLPRLAEFENLVVLQTLSKAWGMAGLRLGLAFASEYIVGLMSRVKYPYNINIVTQKLVGELLQTPIESVVAQIVEQREIVAAAISSASVVRHIYPSDANFLLVEVDDAPKIYQALIGEGIIVRDRSRVHGCGGCLRITIGTPAENDRLIEKINSL